MSNLTEQKSDLINEDLFATSTANDPELLYIRSYDQDDEWFSVFHSHPFVEIFYVVDGKGEFVTEEKTIIVEKNDIIIINSDLQHTERLIEGENFTYVVLGISNF
ncbi:MAG: cupin domain-containing protein, partial [Clostridiaceae bacterium]|nr:cupin domain-containing protein [Clostridiaceae bacterium]